MGPRLFLGKSRSRLVKYYEPFGQNHGVMKMGCIWNSSYLSKTTPCSFFICFMIMGERGMAILGFLES